MPRRSNDFQKLVYIIQQQLAPDFQVVESYMLTDSVTSEEREVDIVISSPSNISPFVIGIECCDRSRKASVEWVEQMWAKHHDLPTTKLMLAARAGYSRSARFKATARGIDIIDYSEAIKADWSKVLKLWRDSLIVAVAIKTNYAIRNDLAIPPNTRLQRTPLRVEQDRAFFSARFCYNVVAINRWRRR